MLTHDDLKRLAGVTGPCLTIFQPLRDEYSQVTKPVTRVVAAMQEAERLLTEKGFTPAEREEMLRPVAKIASNTDWAGRTGSVIIFRAPDFTMVNFWPDTLAPRIHFAQEFLVLPLLPDLLSNRDFWLLALSIKAVRLFRGARNGLVEVPLPRGVPKSLTQNEQFDQPDHSVRDRSSAGPSVGKMPGVQFGTSSARELQTNYLHDFFKAIEHGIHPILAEDRQPLILAAVTRELAIYRRVNTYSPVLSGAIHGSPDALGMDLLYTKAAELMSAYSALATDGTLREMDEAASHSLLVTDPAEIIEDARIGQVDELIVSPAASGCAQREDSVNWAALATIRNSGRISVLSASQLESGVAAILRFRPAETIGEQTPEGVAQQQP
jgi:hypothetical protein